VAEPPGPRGAHVRRSPGQSRRRLLHAGRRLRPEDSTPRVAKGLGNYPVPIILLARLAVDRTEQGKGLGAALLRDAIFRAARAADIVGCRAILVHAKDKQAQAFYRRFGFEPSPVNELHLYLLMKDIIASQARPAGQS
jgi:GNAT superfamily N-acetyltransferase